MARSSGRVLLSLLGPRESQSPLPFAWLWELPAGIYMKIGHYRTAGGAIGSRGCATGLSPSPFATGLLRLECSSLRWDDLPKAAVVLSNGPPERREMRQISETPIEPWPPPRWPSPMRQAMAPPLNLIVGRAQAAADSETRHIHGILYHWSHAHLPDVLRPRAYALFCWRPEGAPLVRWQLSLAPSPGHSVASCLPVWGALPHVVQSRLLPRVAARCCHLMASTICPAPTARPTQR